MNNAGKMVTWICMFSVLFMGCYTHTPVTKDELRANVAQDITVFTKDSLEYNFSKGNYSIRGDTLSGIGIKRIGGWLTDRDYHGTILLADIASLKTEECDLAGTMLCIVIFGLGAGVVVFTRFPLMH
jgi:hypothetical protein